MMPGLTVDLGLSGSSRSSISRWRVRTASIGFHRTPLVWYWRSTASPMQSGGIDMSVLDQTRLADIRYGEAADRRVGVSFRATITGTSGAGVQIQRVGPWTPNITRMPRAHRVCGDEVICHPVNGKPVIVGR